jgi:hypothetical protein
MLISARESSKILASSGVARQQSRRALLSGLAGSPVRGGAVLLYDEAHVRQLASWQWVDHDDLLAASPAGVLVVRLGPGAEPDVDWSWERRVEAYRRQPEVGLAAWLQIRAYLRLHERLACVVTVCGYPVLLADLVACDRVIPGEVDLGLEPPGAWSSILHRRRLVTSPGPPWLLLGSQPYLGRAAQARDEHQPVGAARSTTWSRWA